VQNGEASKTNGNHVNGTNGGAHPDVNLRGKTKTRVNNEDGGRTTMVVRLHPGQTNRLSAYVEDQDSPSGRSWLAEVQPGGDTSSICGLEISFSSVPQEDIDIKVIPGDGNLEDGSEQIVLDENKTRE